ncbi:hypothetical protein LSUB1_G008669 [Lachnellula subtilissima]|uniref:Extracellular protein n=1 Tax=Lachnellula subtilissima TaxID=602034 RepID=A0A8H8RBT5_9HELO|nr:hypothetical protein LSUB1_G008669 [Lachnellula subtilissima]
MQYTTILAALALGSTTAMAHMEMSFPPPLKSKFNSHAKNADYSMTSPLSGVAQFPCKGYQTAMSDTTGEGASVVTWAPGAKANFTVVGGATHSGGSCQAALSYDVGKTFTVIHSYIGNCPTSSGQNFDFTIPSDAKTGSALFAWTWFNKVGNREIYMNCASVTIGAASKKRTISERDTAFSSRPGLFVANVDPNGCHSVEGKDLAFPDPGPDLTGTAGATDTIAGACVAVNGIGGPSSGSSSGGSSGGASASAPAASGSSAPSASSAASGGSTASSAAAAAPIASSAAAGAGAGAAAAGTATASAPASSGTGTSGSLTVSSHGECGARPAPAPAKPSSEPVAPSGISAATQPNTAATDAKPALERVAAELRLATRLRTQRSRHDSSTTQTWATSKVDEPTFEGIEEEERERERGRAGW